MKREGDGEFLRYPGAYCLLYPALFPRWQLFVAPYFLAHSCLQLLIRPRALLFALMQESHSQPGIKRSLIILSLSLSYPWLLSTVCCLLFCASCCVPPPAVTLCLQSPGNDASALARINSVLWRRIHPTADDYSSDASLTDRDAKVPSARKGTSKQYSTCSSARHHDVRLHAKSPT